MADGPTVGQRRDRQPYLTDDGFQVKGAVVPYAAVSGVPLMLTAVSRSTGRPRTVNRDNGDGNGASPSTTTCPATAPAALVTIVSTSTSPPATDTIS
jgi:hypothetical protein